MKAKSELVLIALSSLLLVLLAAIGCRDNKFRVLPTPTLGPQPPTFCPPTVATLHGAYTNTPPASFYTPTDRPTPTETQGPESATATMTLTPPIIEVSPLPRVTLDVAEVNYRYGVFVPVMDMNERSCTDLRDSCLTGGTLPKGQALSFFAIVTFYESGDMWLCIDSALTKEGNIETQCARVVAYKIGGKIYGEIRFPNPAGASRSCSLAVCPRVHRAI